MDKNYVLQKCFHCGNKGLMEINYYQKQKMGGPIEDDYGNCIGSECEVHFEWSLLSCPVCKKMTFKEVYSDESTNFHFAETNILYPQNTFDNYGVPQSIASSFEAALKVKDIDAAICLLSLRKVLEAICKDKGAKGKDLQKMIENMITNKILPPMFNDACWIIRQLGNSAAHSDNSSFSMFHVNQTIGFLESMINYLYSLPMRIQNLKLEIEAQKNNQ